MNLRRLVVVPDIAIGTQHHTFSINTPLYQSMEYLIPLVGSVAHVITVCFHWNQVEIAKPRQPAIKSSNGRDIFKVLTSKI